MAFPLLFLCLLLADCLPQDFLRVPSGKLLHKDCIHQVPDGSHFRIDSENIIVQTKSGETIFHPLCPEPPINLQHGPAWKAWAEYNNSFPITYLQTTWDIPDKPSGGGALLYYWNGIEPTDNSAVLQPVLQYGSGPAGGGDFWGLASWYVSSTTAVHSDLITCTGASVTGTLTLASNNSWTVLGVCGSQTASFNYNPQFDPPYTWGYPCVLEAYDLNTCIDDYPSSGSVTFTDISMKVGKGKPVTADWDTKTKDATCNEHVVVNSPKEVELLWSTGK